MRKYILWCALLHTFLLFSGQNNEKSGTVPRTNQIQQALQKAVPSKEGSGTTTVVNNFIINDASPLFTNDPTNLLTAEQHQEQTSENINITQTYAQAFQKMISQTKEWPTQLQQLLWQYKFYIAGTTFISLYAYIYTIYARAATTMSSKRSWGLWQADVPLQELMSKSTKELSKSLVQTIYKKNIYKANPKDNIWPLARFVEQIEKEKQIIKRYMFVQKAIAKLKLVKAFPLYQGYRLRAKQHLNRLQFIHQLFLQWSAIQNLNPNHTQADSDHLYPQDFQHQTH